MASSLVVEETTNNLIVEATKNALTVKTFDVWTNYYFLQPTQVLAEHKEVGP